MNMRMGMGALAVALSVAAPGARADEAADIAVLSRVLSAVMADVADDYIGDEHLVLARSADADENQADLHVFAGAPDDAAGKWLASYPGVAFVGNMAGQQPSLRLSDKGSIQILSEQTAMGRAPWQQTLTVAMRNNRLVVAGFSYSVADRHVGATRVCDWNLLTGKWTVERSGPDTDGNDRPDLNISGSKREDMSLAQWVQEEDYFPQFCADAE